MSILSWNPNAFTAATLGGYGGADQVGVPGAGNNPAPGTPAWDQQWGLPNADPTAGGGSTTPMDAGGMLSGLPNGGILGSGLPSPNGPNQNGGAPTINNYYPNGNNNQYGPIDYALANASGSQLADPWSMATLMNNMMGPGVLPQSPAQVAGISQQAAALAAMQGEIGAAHQNAMGQIGSSYWGAQPGILSAQNQIPLAQIGSQTQLGLGGMQLAGTENTNAANLAGTENTNAANQNIAGINANAATGVAGIQAGPQYAGIDALLSLFGHGTGGTSTGGAGGLPGLGLPSISPGSGIGGGIAGAGGSGPGLNMVGGSGDASGQPPVPSFQPLNAEQLQQNLGAGQSQIDQNYADLRNQLLQSGANNGMNTTAGAGGLNPGLQAQIQQRQNMDQAANALNFENFASQENNQNNLAYGGMNLGQYNANQNRALQELGILAPYQYGQAGAGYGILSGLLPSLLP